MINTSKTLLAKLLAKENIEVREGNFETASFSITDRVLNIPRWNFENPHFLEMILGHEVSHALHTSKESLDIINNEIGKKYFSIWNIIEDIRIERIIQSQYPGIIHSFNEAYKHLVDTDFFKLKDVRGGLANIRFIDRLNLHAKAGKFVKIPLNAKEQDFYNRCLVAQTEDEVMDLVREAIELVKEEQDQQKNKPQSEDSQQNESGGSNLGESTEELDEANENVNSTTDIDIEEDSSNSNSSTKPTTDETQDKPENTSTTNNNQDNTDYSSRTQDTLDEYLKNSTQKDEFNTWYIPKNSELEKLIIPFSKVHEARLARQDYFWPDDTTFIAFRKKSEKVVGYLVNEFERKKAAYQYSRAKVSSKGALNMNALHRYKLDDNIFKSIMTMADSKSHGMVMLVDYSCSMSGRISRVLEQIFNLSLFCKRVQIPFAVYGFTSSSSNLILNKENKNAFDMSECYMFELINSSLSKADFTKALRGLYASIATQTLQYTKVEIMNSTPLFSAIAIASSAIAKLKQNHNVQKMNLILLTDGGANDSFFTYIDTNDEVVFDGKVLISRLQKSKYRWLGSRHLMQNYVSSILNSIAKKYDCEIIGVFISGGTSSRSFNTVWSSFDLRKTVNSFNDMRNYFIKEMKKNDGFCCINVDGYSNLFVILDSSLDIEEDQDLEGDFDVNDKKSMRNLLNEFKAKTGSSKSTRIIMNKFAEIIA